MSRVLPPVLLLLAYGIAFGWVALSGGLLVADDHPGQLYRLYHVVTLGWAPWRLNPGWWAGYAELQYYPPGAAWLGAALHQGSLGLLAVSDAYQAVLWIAWLLPGLSTFVLLTRVLGSGWLALPGAFVALTLSAGSRSGVEEGLRWGLIAARLGWGLLPLVALALVGWVEGARRIPLLAAPVVAAVILLHPAHAPAALALVGLGACFAPAPRSRSLGQAAVVIALALGLSAVWLLPLLAHLNMALPLAWGDASAVGLLSQIAARPLLIALAVAQLGAWLAMRGSSRAQPAARWLHAFTPAMALLVALDALVAAPLGLLWLPADRLADGLLLALVLGAALITRPLAERLPRLGPAGAVAASLFAFLLLSGGAPEPSLTLWPARGQWPVYDEVVRGARVETLWQALKSGPPGRVLFLRSALALDGRPEWWRPHTHITALTPLFSDRPIINGTFTHPAPLAGFFYTGSASPRAITVLVEERDGRTLFGQPLESVTAAAFSRWCGRLGVSIVVAAAEDDGRFPFLAANLDFSGPDPIGPFRVYRSWAARSVPVSVGPQRWRLGLSGAEPEWAPAGMAYSPNTRAESGDRLLSTRSDDMGMLEIKRPGAGPVVVELSHPAATFEWLGLFCSALSLTALLGAGIVLVKQARAPHDRAR